MSAKDYLVQNIISELVGYLMKDFGWDIQSAMRAVYHSALFQKLFLDLNREQDIITVFAMMF